VDFTARLKLRVSSQHTWRDGSFGLHHHTACAPGSVRESCTRLSETRTSSRGPSQSGGPKAAVPVGTPLLGFIKDRPSTDISTLRPLPSEQAQLSAMRCQPHRMVRPCRFSRLRRFTPRGAAQVYCTLLPAMGFAMFPARRSALSPSRSWALLPTAPRYKHCCLQPPPVPERTDGKGAFPNGADPSELSPPRQRPQRQSKYHSDPKIEVMLGPPLRLPSRRCRWSSPLAPRENALPAGRGQ
jgi:hypothetical protein